MCSMKKQPPVGSIKKDGLKTFTELIGKYKCRSLLFLIKLHALGLNHYEKGDSETG